MPPSVSVPSGDLRARAGVRRQLAALNASAPATSSRSAGSISSSASGSAGGVMDGVVGDASGADGFLVSAYGDESSSASSDADLMYRRTQGSCAYYPVSAGGCRAPRSCFDCLNYVVAPERAGCMVNERGQCVSMTGNYTAARDFHFATAVNANATASGSASAIGVDVGATLISGPGSEFAAANASYCSWGDAKCTACRRNIFLDYSPGSITRTSLFCLGDDGCVCIALCEMNDWSMRVGGSQCFNTTAAGQTGSSASSTAGNMTPANAGGTADDSARGGVGGKEGGGTDTGASSFWGLAGAVLGLLAVALAVVMYMSKRHRQSYLRRNRDLGTPQAPALSPRRDPRPPESLLAALFRRTGPRSTRSTRVLRAGSATAEASTHQTDGGSAEDTSDDGRSLRLFGWRAMREQVLEKETLEPVVVSSGIRRVAISSCVPCEPGYYGDTVSSECLTSSRSLPTLGMFEEDGEHALLGEDARDSRRFTASSLSSSAMLSPPSYVIPFMDEHEGFDGEIGHENSADDCFDELVTPPAMSRMLL